MSYDARIQAAGSDPQQLEQLFQAALRSGQVGDFQAAVVALHGAAPDDVLLTAWVYRLQSLAEESGKAGRSINWAAAVPLSIVTGLIFWAISGGDLALDVAVPQVFLWWSPIATLSALTFMALTARRGTGRALALGLALLAAGAYVLLLEPAFGAPWASQQYVKLAMIHIPLLSWTALGIYTLGFRSSATDRFAFLIKSLEVMIVAGLYLGAGLVFGGITMGLFTALGITLPEVLVRLIMAGGFGLLPVLALATIYDPRVAPAAQDFEQGLSKFIATMMRLLLPLTLGVLVIYVFLIPLNFFAPFESRDLLIVYNAMLFAIIGLLVGATPMPGAELTPELQKVLRLGILLVAGLAVLVSVYALSAVVYRTFQGELTPNRLTVIGWNGVNIGILLAVLVTQVRRGREGWIERLQSVFLQATNAYAVWGLFLLIALPILF